MKRVQHRSSRGKKGMRDIWHPKWTDAGMIWIWGPRPWYPSSLSWPCGDKQQAAVGGAKAPCKPYNEWNTGLDDLAMNLHLSAVQWRMLLCKGRCSLPGIFEAGLSKLWLTSSGCEIIEHRSAGSAVMACTEQICKMSVEQHCTAIQPRSSCLPTSQLHTHHTSQPMHTHLTALPWYEALQ